MILENIKLDFFGEIGFGFIMEINNATQRSLFIKTTRNYNVRGTPFPFETTLPPGGTTGPLYYETAAEVEKSALPGTIFFLFEVASSETGHPGYAEIRLVPSIKDEEFEGSIYLASFQHTPIASSRNRLIPVLLVNKTEASGHKWPRGVLAIAEMVP